MRSPTPEASSAASKAGSDIKVASVDKVVLDIKGDLDNKGVSGKVVSAKVVSDKAALVEVSARTEVSVASPELDPPSAATGARPQKARPTAAKQTTSPSLWTATEGD